MAVTLRWSRRRYQRQTADDGTTTYAATLVWEVDGVTSEDEAINAVPEAAEGAAHPRNNSLIVSTAAAEEPRKGLWEVTAQYAWRPPVGGPGGPPTGPILGKPRFSFVERSISAAFDIDDDGNTVCNSAKDAVNPPDEKELTVFDYTVVIDELFYDAEFARPFFNTVNEDVLVTPFGSFPPLSAQCKTIIPAEVWIPGMQKIKVAYKLEVRDRSQYPGIPDSMSPFDSRMLDQGINAYYEDVEGNLLKAQIHSRQHGPVSEPVRLNGSGAPFDFKSYKVGKAIKTAVSVEPPPGAIVVRLADAAYLYWKKYPRKAFGELGLPTGLET